MKSPIVESLRINAKVAPLWEDIMNAAADEIERLHEKENAIKAEAVRREIENLHNLYPHLDGPHLGILAHRANQIERGDP